MAFCTSCGANLDPNAKFCTSCGTTVPAAAAPAPPVTSTAAPVSTAPAESGNAFKVVLIVLGVVFAIALLSIAAVVYTGYRVAKSVKVEEEGTTTRVETPFGTIEADKRGSAEVAKKVGIDVYPGAEAIEGNAIMNLGGKTVAAANFETDDDPEKVFEFYKERYPDARLVSQQDDEYHIMSGDDEEAVNIHIRREGGKTQISMTKFTAD